MPRRGSEKKVAILNTEYSIWVCFGDDDYIFNRLRAHGFDDVEPGDVNLSKNRGQCFHRADCHPLVALKRKPKTPEEYGTLAHEATHAVTHIFEYINQDLYGEVFAHSVGAAVREALK